MKRCRFIYIFLLVSISFLSGCVNKKSYKGNEESYFTSSIAYKENFKILTLSDIHFSFTDNLEVHARVIKKTVDEAKPDLIVLLGDMFIFAKKSTVNYLFDLIDNIGGDNPIPWTFTNGNHDEQSEFNENYLIEAALKRKNAKIVDNRYDDVSGRTNFIINLVDGEDIKHQVFIIDSHSHALHKLAYQSIQKDQVEWYEHMVNYTKEKCGHLVKSSMFFHIPTLEIKNWILNEEFDPNTTQSGGLLEDIYAPNTDNQFMSKVVELASTKSVVYGHDHINDFIFEHQGVKCAYSYTSTNRVYWTEEKLGGLLLTLQSDGTSIMKQIKVEY